LVLPEVETDLPVVVAAGSAAEKSRSRLMEMAEVVAAVGLNLTVVAAEAELAPEQPHRLLALAPFLIAKI